MFKRLWNWFTQPCSESNPCITCERGGRYEPKYYPHGSNPPAPKWTSPRPAPSPPPPVSGKNKENKMSDNIKVENTPVAIVAIIDKSGSMGSIRNDAIGSFNTFIEEQKKVEGEATLTVIQFDHEYEVMQKNVPLAESVLFDEKNYVPRGMTALNDAIGRTVNDLITRRNAGEVVSAIVMILTDGAENQSVEYSTPQIKELIEKCEKEYGWQFVYLAANQDAFSVGAGYGIKSANAFNFSADAGGLADVSRAMSGYTTTYRNSNR